MGKPCKDGSLPLGYQRLQLNGFVYRQYGSSDKQGKPKTIFFTRSTNDFDTPDVRATGLKPGLEINHLSIPIIV